MGITKTLVIDDAEKLAFLYEQERKNFIEHQQQQQKRKVNKNNLNKFKQYK